MNASPADPSPRDAVLDRLALDLVRRCGPHALRVAIDGITAAGKTTFADELASAVEGHGHPAHRVSLDGFHHPRARRHRQGRWSADGYYEDAYDFERIAADLLGPLGPGGSGRYRTAALDLVRDEPVEHWAHAGAQNVVLVDGSFLQRAPVGLLWDVVIWLDVDFDTARARGVARDAAAFGGAAAATRAFVERYHAAGRRYLREVDPITHATIVVEHRDPQRPHVVRAGGAAR